MIEIRPAILGDDGDAFWAIFHAVVASGDTYVFAPNTTKDEALAIWFAAGATPFVAAIDGNIVGTYVIKPNFPALGNHVANGSYMVHPQAFGQGVGKAMGQHSIQEAERQGYQAMQFNIVVSTNTVAVKLWQRLGFSIIGTSPKAFRHATLGLVDTHIMHRFLS